MNDYCTKCEDNGILGVVGGIPVTCSCQTGKNAKEANPDWLTEADLQ